MTRNPVFLVFWAKSGTPCQPLLAHMLDTAAVALEILRREPPRTRKLYAEDWSFPQDMALTWVAFLVGLHDLGKASPVFQSRWPEGAERVRQAGLTWDEERIGRKETWVAHGVLTELYLNEFLRDRGLSRRVTRPLAQGLGAHHGFQARGEELRRARILLNLEESVWKKARFQMVKLLERNLDVHFPQVQEIRPEAILRIMALASFADWIASDPAHFPYGRDPLTPDYLRQTKKLARIALEELGWRTAAPLPLKPFAKVFPHIPKPNPLQEAIPELLERALSTDTESPFLILVEAPMGTGKTEAALFAHLFLQNRLSHRGFYIALPTQATGNGLFPRVRSFLEQLVQGRLDLQLQHGTAILNPEYEALLESSHPKEIYDSEDGPQKGEEGGVVASAWFSARKRAMLSRHGVGTLDQALLGVLKVKHHFVRLWGLMNRVVILDEVHAYDVYTSGLLQALLRWLRTLGSSVIIMTATLPRSRRNELLKAWGPKDEKCLNLGPYPRVALLSGENLVGIRHIEFRKRTEVQLERVPVEEESLANELITRLPGAVGAIVNTVDRAQNLYRAFGEGECLTLKSLVDHLGKGPDQGPWPEIRDQTEEKEEWIVGKVLPDGTLIFLLHARFPAEERALREAVALALFGKYGPRPEKTILVATQVAEQSLDLDFDLLYTDLAPMDLIFQRAGRLHRHARERPEEHQSPVLLWSYPHNLDFDTPLYWHRVYEDFVLLSTWLALKERKVLVLPENLEPLLDEVYERKPEDFPKELKERARKSAKKLTDRLNRETEIARNLAIFEPEEFLSRTGASDLPAAFTLDDDLEDGRTQRLLTRLGDPSVAVVFLYRLGGGLFLDPQGKHPVKLKGKLGREEALAIWGRAVRLSRYPIPQELLKEEPPPAWRRSGLLRGLKPLEVGRVFSWEKGGLRVELDPELGVVYHRER